MSTFISIPKIGILEVLSSCLAMIILSLLAYCVYNVRFHPLSRFPGPRRAAVSPLWTIRHWLGGNYIRTIKALHEEYGSVVRTAAGQVSFCSGSSWKDIYGHNLGRKAFLKASFYEPLPGEAINTVSVSNPSYHASMSKTFSHGFSASALTAQEDLVQHFVNHLIHQVDKYCSNEPGDMVKWYNCTTFDGIGELAFGDPFGCLESGRRTLSFQNCVAGLTGQGNRTSGLIFCLTASNLRTS